MIYIYIISTQEFKIKLNSTIKINKNIFFFTNKTLKSKKSSLGRRFSYREKHYRRSSKITLALNVEIQAPKMQIFKKEFQRNTVLIFACKKRTGALLFFFCYLCFSFLNALGNMRFHKNERSPHYLLSIILLSAIKPKSFAYQLIITEILQKNWRL